MFTKRGRFSIFSLIFVWTSLTAEGCTPPEPDQVDGVTQAVSSQASGRINCDLVGLTEAGAHDGNRIVVFSPDLTEGEVLSEISRRYDLAGIFASGMPPRLFAIGGDRDRSPGRIYSVDVETGDLSSVFDTGLSRISAVVATSDARVYVWSRGIWEVNLTTHAKRLRVASNEPVENLAVDASGTVFAYTNRKTFKLSVGASSLRSVGNLGQPLGAITSSHGRLVGVGDSRGHSCDLELGFFDITSGRSLRAPSEVDVEGLHGRHTNARLSALAYPPQCAAPRAPLRARLISRASATPSTVCPGDTVVLHVDAAHPVDRTIASTTTIDGVPGTERTVQIPNAQPGPLLFGAHVTTEDGLYEDRDIRVNVVACPNALRPNLVASPNPYRPSVVDIWVSNASAFGAGAHFAFDFGDGNGTTVDVPHAEHDYTQALASSVVLNDFEVSVHVTSADGSLSSAAKTISITNDYVLMRAYGVSEAESTGIEQLDIGNHFDAGSVPVTIRNPGDEPMSLTALRVRYQPCNDSAEPQDELRAVAFTVAPRATSTVNIDIASLPDLHARGACAVSLYLTGTAGTLRAAASHHLGIDYGRNGSQYSSVSDPVLVALLDAAVQRGLLASGAPTSDAELYRFP